VELELESVVVSDVVVTSEVVSVSVSVVGVLVLGVLVLGVLVLVLGVLVLGVVFVVGSDDIVVSSVFESYLPGGTGPRQPPIASGASTLRAVQAITFSSYSAWLTGRR
jgi:hypothetical protein